MKLKPSDVKDYTTALKLQEQGVRIGQYSMDIKPSVVRISINSIAEISVPMSIMKKFAEWYLTEQEVNECCGRCDGINDYCIYENDNPGQPE